MRLARTRKSDATFDLNLAPVLDIIVAIIPLLLLSVAFIQVRMIEAPVPQLVEEKIKSNEPPGVSIGLKVSSSEGFAFTINNKGARQEVRVGLANGKLDFENLKKNAIQIKRQHQDTFKLDLAPAQSVSYEEIVKTMDTVRKADATVPKFQITDTKTGKVAETDLIFPDVVFANVVGD